MCMVAPFQWDTDVASTNVNIWGGTITNVYGGGFNGKVNGDTNVTITGGTITNVYGGGFKGKVNGDTNVTITGGAITGTVKGDGGTLGGTIGGNKKMAYSMQI